MSRFCYRCQSQTSMAQLDFQYGAQNNHVHDTGLRDIVPEHPQDLVEVESTKSRDGICLSYACNYGLSRQPSSGSLLELFGRLFSRSYALVKLAHAAKPATMEPFATDVAVSAPVFCIQRLGLRSIVIDTRVD